MGTSGSAEREAVVFLSRVVFGTSTLIGNFSKSRGRGWTGGVPRWHSNAMGERVQIPDIPEEARTPLVKGLVDIIEQLVQKVQQQDEKLVQLEDEIAVLKGGEEATTIQAQSVG